MDKGLNNLWPTTVLYDKIQDEQLMGEVVNEIFTKFDIANPPSDLGAYSIFDEGSGVLARFRDEIALPAFGRYMQEVYNEDLDSYKGNFVKAWITGSTSGYNMAKHNHSGSQLTAVFYVLAEHTENGGHLVLTDPRSNANRGYPTELQGQFQPVIITPKTGDFLVFPSFLYHHVTTYYSNFRLCIPVDLTLGRDE